MARRVVSIMTSHHESRFTVSLFCTKIVLLLLLSFDLMRVAIAGACRRTMMSKQDDSLPKRDIQDLCVIA